MNVDVAKQLNASVEMVIWCVDGVVEIVDTLLLVTTIRLVSVPDTVAVIALPVVDCDVKCRLRY